MYRLDKIVEALKPVVGWEQGYTEKEQISELLTKSESGHYFQEAHPYLTLRAMEAVAPQGLLSSFPAWNRILTYFKGAKVVHNGKVWELTVESDRGTEPALAAFNDDFNEDFDSNPWKESNVLSITLEKRTEAGIKKVVTKFVQDKVTNYETRNIIDRRTLFDGAGRLNERIASRDKIVGFEILPIRGESVVMTLESLGIQMTGNTGPVRFYLFHSSCPTPLWTKTVDYTKTNGTFMWFDLDNIALPYRSDLTNAGGSWYLVYNQRELPAFMDAINYTRDWSKGPCATCNRGDAQLFAEMGKYYQISPFMVDAPEEWDETLWDVQDMIYTNTSNYGINLRFSIGCDLTNFIIDNRLMFAPAIQKQVAVDCLREIALNPEVNVNRVQSNVARADILFEVEGNGQGIRGLSGELSKAYKALEFDTKGIDRICLACHTGGVRFRSM